MEPGNVLYASRATSYPRQQHYTFAFLPPFSISTLIKTLKKIIRYQKSAFLDYQLPLTQKNEM